MLSLRASFPKFMLLVSQYVRDVAVLGTRALVSRVVRIVVTTESVEEVVKFLRLVAKRLGLATLAVLLSMFSLLLPFLLDRILIVVFPILVICYIRDSSKIWLPPLAVGVVVLSFFLTPFYFL